MPLDRIQSAVPVIIPAREAKEYPDLYITDFTLGFRELGKQPAQVVFRSYNYDLKEIDMCEGANIKFSIDNLWDEVQRSSMVADVAGRLTALLNLLYQEAILRGKLSGPNYKDRDEDIAKLHVVQAMLGAALDEVPPPREDITNWAKPEQADKGLPPAEEPVAPAEEPVAPPAEPTSQEIWDSLSFTEIV